MRLPTTLALLACAIALMAGCGGGSGETGSQPVDAGSSTQAVQSAWEAKPDCMRPQGASRWGCSVGRYRCQAVVTDRGRSVSCARPGRSISFTAPRRK